MEWGMYVIMHPPFLCANVVLITSTYFSTR